jgi:hypothetical protein
LKKGLDGSGKGFDRHSQNRVSRPLAKDVGHAELFGVVAACAAAAGIGGEALGFDHRQRATVAVAQDVVGKAAAVGQRDFIVDGVAVVDVPAEVGKLGVDENAGAGFVVVHGRRPSGVGYLTRLGESAALFSPSHRQPPFQFDARRRNRCAEGDHLDAGGQGFAQARP